MRILFVAVDPPCPSTNGHRIRTAAVLRALAADGHEVTLVSFHDPRDPVDHEELSRLCRSVELVPPTMPSRGGVAGYFGRLRGLASRLPYTAYRFSSERMRATLALQLSGSRFDLVLCDQAHSATSLPRGPKPPVVIDTLLISFVLLRRYLEQVRNPLVRLYGGLEFLKMRRWEMSVCAGVSALIACSEIERRQYAEMCPHVPAFLVPNVVDTERFLPVDDPGGLTVLYTGGMDWHPNRDAVSFFVSAILPELRRLVPGVKLRVAGRAPDEGFRRRFASDPAVEFSGTVPDMRTEIGRAAVCVVPLRIGSGTRLKILEAGAMEKAIVSTRLGAEGLELRDGEEILLADDGELFARSVAGLLRDASRRLAVGRAARRRVEKQYGTPVLESALRECVYATVGPR